MFDSTSSWLLILAVGVSIGLVAAAIDIVAAWLTDVRLGYCQAEWYLPRGICCTGYPEDDCPRWRGWSSLYVVDWLFYIAYSTLFATVTAVIVVLIAPNAAGSGTAEVKTILGGFATKDFLDFKTLLVKSLALPLTVASGLAVGKEGPMIHVACCIGNLWPNFFQKYQRNEGE
ncbi:glycerol ethanol, ferric requiring protein [Entophlyctis luteolus]|nr:glycerol ethanol, ferric requiring protein [Entophlyctis luteolus]